MPEFKKSKGYKMKGFSYPGESPLKGKRKRAQQAAAQEDLIAAQDKISEFGEMEMKSTDILGGESFRVSGAGLPETSPVKNIDWTAIGQAAMEAGSEAIIAEGVKAGVGALTKKKDKPGHEGPDITGFSSLKFGRK